MHDPGVTQPSDEPTPPERAVFMAEHYWPGVTADAFQSAVERVRAAAGDLAAAGTEIRFLHSTLVLDDESAFCVFEAHSQTVVEQAYARAGVSYQRLLDALEMPAQSGRTTPGRQRTAPS